MVNPFYNLSIDNPGDFGRMSVAGIRSDITSYTFLDIWFAHGPGDLLIARKDQFRDAESALVAFIQRAFYLTDDYYSQERLYKMDEESFIYQAEDLFVPMYGNCQIKEIPVEKFTVMYDGIISYMTGYFNLEDVDKKTHEYVYKTVGIFRNDEEYSGDYFLFNPLQNITCEKCFSVYDNEEYQKEFRKEYFAITASHYIYLLWHTRSWLTPMF